MKSNQFVEKPPTATKSFSIPIRLLGALGACVFLLAPPEATGAPSVSEAPPKPSPGVDVNYRYDSAALSGPGAVDGCGCALDRSRGITYGFYPLLAKAANQKLDFGVLSRIGLYGMTIDDKGALRMPSGVNTKPWTLLEAAHRHMTRVDWVLYKNDWPEAGGPVLADLLRNIRQNIDRLLRTPFPKTDLGGTALVTLGLEPGPSVGDGITLRFERFPGTPEAQLALRSFVSALYRQLREMKPARQLNIMVTQDEILGGGESAAGEGRPYSVANLNAMMQLTDNTRAGVRVLVMLHEPASSQNRLLRSDIENTLFGSQRERMLRSVVPVLEYDGKRFEQLNDDIIYLMDNFGGIGFWPLQFATAGDSADGSTTANHVLHRYFENTGADSGFAANLTDLICPNRKLLRWLAWMSSIFAIWLGIQLLRSRGCSTRLDKNRIYPVLAAVFISLPFALIAALVVGDPLLQSDSGVHSIIVAVLIGLAIVPGLYGLLRWARKLP